MLMMIADANYIRNTDNNDNNDSIINANEYNTNRDGNNNEIDSYYCDQNYHYHH